MHPFILILFSALANASVNIVLKTALSRARETTSFLTLVLTLAKNPLFWLGGMLCVVSLISYSMALQRLNLTIAYPLLVSIVTLVLTSVSLIYMGESLTFARVVGITCLLSGVWLIVR